MQSKVCLNGYWDFLPLQGAGTADGEWICGKYRVPSSWCSDREMFDIFGYPKEWSQVTKGALRRTVEICYTPGTRVFLRLDAVGKQAHILGNGKELAYTDDMFLPVEAELTELLAPGRNCVEIQVICDDFPAVTRSDGVTKLLVPSGTWYARTTMGIWQDAWLVTRPAVYLCDPFILTDYQNKTISFTVDKNLPGMEGETCVVEENGEKLQKQEKFSIAGEVLDADGKVVLELKENEIKRWENPHLWMPDDPYLYTLRMKLMEEAETKDELTQRFGFRQIWNEKHALFINGVRINLRGDAWHYQGLAMQRKEYADNWCRFAKDQGINYFRPHGFPYPRCFFDAADESGMLIMAESGIYGSGKAMQADDPRFIEACEKHLCRFTREYRNHPSVFCWSMQNEMRWVDGREGYKQAIPKLMDVMAREDPSKRLVSCDGDNRLLTDEMMQAVSMHYNIDGRISDWNKEKPLLFGEQGAFHYVSPQNACAFQGERAYTSFWNAMEGVALREAHFLNYARREEVTGVTPFNYSNYMNKAMPFADTPIDPGDITAPGPHPSLLRAYCLTLNNGQMEGYPDYIPQPAIDALEQATACITVLPEEMDSCFLAGRTISRSFRVYNDTFRNESAELTWIAETDSGRILAACKESYEALAGSCKLVNCELKLPEYHKAYDVSLKFILRYHAEAVREDRFTYRVHPRAKYPVSRCSIACLGEEGTVPYWAANDVCYVKTLQELAGVRAKILIIGEEAPFTQKELQPVLEQLVKEKRVKGILILCQSTFTPGQLQLSGKPFFAAHPTGAHPVLAGLHAEDLRFWGPGNVEENEEGWMIENGFELPADSGYRVILECGWGDWGWGGMNWCGLVEGRTHGVPVILTQIRLNDFADSHPAAQILYRNCLSYLETAGKCIESTVCDEVLLCDARELAGMADVLKEGKTLIVTNVTAAQETLLGEVLGRRVKVKEEPAYQLERAEHPLMNGVSNAQLTGLEKVTYSAASLHNEYVAQNSVEAEDVEWLLSSVDASWTVQFTQGWEAEPVKVASATGWSNGEFHARCYGFAANVGKGKLIVLQLLQNSMDKLRLCLETIAMNAGKQYETKMFTVFKKEMSYSIPEFVWLKVEDMWDYEAAVAYHASPDFLLNNLGEGSYGWMQRVSAEKGIVTLKGSAGKRVFVTVFAECALNHDPEKRDAGEIPDPSIVPDVTVICNAAFCLYVNGRKFEGLQTLPEKVQETVIKDVLLEKGMNRLFFEISAGDQDVVLGAVFRDKLGTFLTDTRYRLTLD